MTAFSGTLDLGSKLLRQDSEITLPRGSVSDLPFSLKEVLGARSVSGLRALCYRPFPEGYLRTLRQTGPGPNFGSETTCLILFDFHDLVVCGDQSLLT